MSQSSKTLSIGEVAKVTGLRASALRYYECVGVLPAPSRTGGQRVYDAGIFKHIQLIQAAQKAGFSIAEIKTLIDASKTSTPYANRMQDLARRKLAEVEKQIMEAQAMKRVLEAGLDCHCAKAEECLLQIG